MKKKTLAFSILGCLLSINVFCQSQPNKNYYFDRSGISREVLENYLSRSITASEFLNVNPYTIDGPYPNKEDDIRLIRNTGAKFIGRAIYRWGREDVLNNPDYLAQARELIEKVHAFDPDIIFQGALFEIVTQQVNQIAIPEWVFKTMDLPVEKRNFNYDNMINPDGKFVELWTKGSSVPDITRQETKLWLLFLAGTYMQIGCEALHLGQTSLMGMADSNWMHWNKFLNCLRKYAEKNTRRGWILLDAHTPHGGMVTNGKSLLDFNSFPLRIKEIVEKPMEGVLEMNYLDALYGKSQGCVTPSGWSCSSLPYLVEFDNFGCSRTPGKATPESHYIWGYDEISWFYLQSEDYRKAWLTYAFYWLKEHDKNGFLQMPVSRVISLCDKSGRYKYRGNTRSESMPDGMNVEETIRELWELKIKN